MSCYKIKRRASGYRLVYQVHEGKLIVLVITTGRRDASQVYDNATRRA
ncbi:stability protein StbE [Acetobacter pomorum]|nr:stability protein StbE [Acetobacter pomorum]AXC26962.1 stability protein StbE [Acetobacter sp. JWB]KAA8421382.1 stability protein StbE [Acetobacter pomorum]KAA8435007.1 stability protein StbE [Acetobacter pomorum]KAA8449171.1 stability protein StbE [Acetobacter pomorum]